MLDSAIAHHIQSILLSSKNILLVSDKRADGDSLGSAVAMFWYLKTHGFVVHVLVSNSVPFHIQYLTKGVDFIFDASDVNLNHYDVIITCDFGSLEQSGIGDLLWEYKNTHGKCLINIDHHETNSLFGHINLVLANMASNTEIIFHLMKMWKVTLTPEISSALMTGLVTDTNNFTNAATTPSAMKVASFLMLSGANIHKIIKKTQKNLSLDALRLWGRVLLRLRKNTEIDMTVTHMTSQDLCDYNLSYDSVDGVADFLNSLSQTKAVLFLREDCGRIKGSLRTTRNDVDVSRIAQMLGGGGHKKAAGFTVNGYIEETANGCRII